ncbi:hypothetical protein JOB18_040047 [Solea senegalensis]|uniref:Uncharacterized protein n=1 Tax=Solea senegalensis TaxID=28829 RepID=A0AAV6RSF9_SOLSE|nr:hypothetical protein JOB18_040047 [Solea senegalensis]
MVPLGEPGVTRSSKEGCTDPGRTRSRCCCRLLCHDVTPGRSSAPPPGSYYDNHSHQCSTCVSACYCCQDELHMKVKSSPLTTKCYLMTGQTRK